MLKTPITFCNFFFIWFTSFQRKCNQKQKKDNSIQIVNSPFLVKIKRSKLVIFKLPLSWDKCAETTIEFLTRYGCYGQTELFESMERGMRAKMEIIRLYPDMGNFTIKAFYEKDAGISAAIQESYHRYYKLKADKTRLNLDPSQFYTRTGYSYDVSRNVLGFGGLSLGNGAVRQCGYRENGKGFNKTDGLLEKHLSA